MSTPAAAIALSRHLTAAAVRERLGTIGERLAYARLETLWADPTQPREPVPEGALEEAVASSPPGSLAERALSVGLAVRDVVVEAETADVVGRVLQTPGASTEREAPALRERYASTLLRLDSARESADRAIARLVEALDDSFSPAVLAAASTLAREIATPPPRFDSGENAQQWPPGARWIKAVGVAIAQLGAALGFPRVPRHVGPPTEDEKQLAREIARFPDDEAIRIMWAGLAEKRGDPRAQLVKEQLARREKQLASPRYVTFRSALEKQLLLDHPEWTDNVKKLGASSGELYGGFVESIVVDAATLLANHRAIMASAPIRRVALTGDVKLLPALVSAGALDRVVWLVLSRLPLDDGLLACLAPLEELRALSLSHCRIDDALVERLWRSFPRLLLCDLDHNPCTDLVTRELTPQEMSTYEWVRTERAVALARQYGDRAWIYPPEGEPPDLDTLLARIAEAG